MIQLDCNREKKSKQNYPSRVPGPAPCVQEPRLKEWMEMVAICLKFPFHPLLSSQKLLSGKTHGWD
jgi:hypothetical protein